MRPTRLNLTIGLLAALGISVAGCSPSEAVPVTAEAGDPALATVESTTVSYACASGREITVSYPDSGSIRLTHLGQGYALTQVLAADGAHYAGADMEWVSSVQNGQDAAVLSRASATGSPTGVVLERCARPVRTPAVAPLPPSPEPADPAQAPPCRGPQLKLEEAGGDAGMGNRVAIVEVRNLGAAACSLTGYPSASLVDDRGQALATVRTETAPGAYFRKGQAPSAVTLASGGRAWFDVAWNVVPHEADGESVCPTATRLRVTAPNDTSPVWLDHRLTPCGGLIRVTPFRTVAEPVPPQS